jgi:glycosyltransferase involved in cell wall biosynthesis
MKIAIDARWIFNEISGIGAHTRELIRHIAREDHTNSYIIIFSDRSWAERTWAEAELSDKPNFRPEIVPWRVFSPLSQLLLPSRLARHNIEVFHSTNYMIPLSCFPRGRMGKIRCVATIHDLIPLLFPGATPRAMKTRLFPIYRRLMLEIGARADRIIAVSEASRSDIVQHLNIPPTRHNSVKVIYNGVAPIFTPDPAPANNPAQTRTLLYVGRSDPYKNLPLLIEAFSQACPKAPFPIQLKILGPPDPRYPEASQRVKELGLEASITWVGYQGSNALVKAYREAAAVVLPSQYEGFGLPVVEAMACGTPMICSDIPVLKEIGGQAAVYAPLGNSTELANSILRVLTDAELRRTMIQRGLEQARLFTWTGAARKTIDLYTELAAAPL